jgi:hypothetical protein
MYVMAGSSIYKPALATGVEKHQYTHQRFGALRQGLLVHLVHMTSVWRQRPISDPLVTQAVTPFPEHKSAIEQVAAADCLFDAVSLLETL